MTTLDRNCVDNATVVLDLHGSEHDQQDSKVVAKMYAAKLVREHVRDNPLRQFFVALGLADNKSVR